MKPTKKQLQEMYDFMKNLYENNETDIYGLKRIYNEFTAQFNLPVDFGIDGNEYGEDDEIYCYVYLNTLGSLVFNWSCKRYTDENFYKDPVNYLLELAEEGEKLKEKIGKAMEDYKITRLEHMKTGDREKD